MDSEQITDVGRCPKCWQLPDRRVWHLALVNAEFAVCSKCKIRWQVGDATVDAPPKGADVAQYDFVRAFKADVPLNVPVGATELPNIG